MPKLRADPLRSGGHITLHRSDRIARLKWLSVLAVMVIATVLESMPVSGSGRATIETVVWVPEQTAAALRSRGCDPAGGCAIKVSGQTSDTEADLPTGASRTQPGDVANARTAKPVETGGPLCPDGKDQLKS